MLIFITGLAIGASLGVIATLILAGLAASYAIMRGLNW